MTITLPVEAPSVAGQGQTDRTLTETEIATLIEQGLGPLPLDGRRVLILVPDHTRTMPLPQFFRLMQAHLQPRTAAADVLVALGTHPPLADAALLRLVGLTEAERAAQYAGVRLINHAWRDPQALATLGTITAEEIEVLSQGRLRQAVPVRLNRLILDYDHVLICGPVFPHEVVGFSGGNKYFFPGIAGQDIIDFTHWLGALITSYAIIGTGNTPVRQVIDRAAAMIPRPRHALCSVVTGRGVQGLFVGTPEAAWAAAAALSAQVHIEWRDRPYQQVLAMLPRMYDELWVGAKGMYKTEPVVADGGEVILYAPHLREISQVHGHLIRQIGYHVRDYFTAQWDRFSDIPWGVLAHSTHVRGIGTYANGVEQPRIRVTLATGLSRAECEAVNLGYHDPASIHPDEWAEREDEGVLLVPHAGEVLYRVRAATSPDPR
jgi:nickel-dependent lactate racemase